ncbi:BICD family-like cargo adapter 1 [Branchiostoma floridae]|uniref:BICD family-like cargo adapter 1 n=1 Tax=Branchiostoma floridae TaxID=7739 RepID=A0A9J7KKA7_BRAFL|nr:BICD family-like cargo adapter 1 [Branchiostoma floridae]
MYACGVEWRSELDLSDKMRSPISTPIDSDDIFLHSFEMALERQNTLNDSSRTDPDDLYAQIEQKEKDLVLAAELGKALLEQNEELNRKVEKLQEDFSEKVELLEQEKHEQKQKLDRLQGEYESRLADIESDITHYQLAAEDAQSNLKVVEREKLDMIADLSEQNQRLTEQLARSCESEKQLSAQVQGLREQFKERNSSNSDHMYQVDSLNAEVKVLRERNSDLERRLSELAEERDGLESTLDASHERIMLLERQKQEMEHKLCQQQRDMSELQQSQNHLQARVDVLQSSYGSGCHGNDQSLYREMGDLGASLSSSMMTLDTVDMTLATGIGHQRFHDDDIEEDFDGDLFYSDDRRSLQRSMSHREEDELHKEPRLDYVMLEASYGISCVKLSQLRNDVLEAYGQLQGLCSALRERTDDDGRVERAAEILQSEDVRSGDLLKVIETLRHYVDNLLERERAALEEVEFLFCFCQGLPQNKIEGHLKKSVNRDSMGQLQTELHEATLQLTQLQENMEDREGDIRHKEQELDSLRSKVLQQEKHISALREEREMMTGGDEVLLQALKDRDSAIEKQNSMEVELAKAKIDVMNLDSQLLEAIQQKISLSQQLEDWQVDMHTLLNKKVRAELQSEEQSSKNSSNGNGRRKFSLWH